MFNLLEVRLISATILAFIIVKICRRGCSWFQFVPRMGCGNIYGRRVRVFAVASMIYLDYKYLSTRADVFPYAYISILKQLQDSLPPRPVQEVCHTIENELGKSVDDLFSYFNRTPLATASIAQVHRATLINGKEVVVKVQHEGIKSVILEDLKNAKSIVDWIAWAEPQYDFNPIMDEWCKEVPKELDFNIEAENTRTVASNLGCRKNNDDNKLAKSVDVLIPEVIQSTEKVLILEYMDGIRLNDNESLEAYGVDKQTVVEEITRAYAHQIYIDGFFNGDPHPGNFLVSKEPPHRPVLLDFGLTKKISTSIKQALAKMFLASVEKWAQAAPGYSRSDYGRNHAILGRAKIKANEGDTGKDEAQRKKKLNALTLICFQIDAFPGDIVIFTRVLNLLRGLSSTMNVRIVYKEVMRPFAESALQGNLNKGPAVNAQWIYDTPSHSDVETKLRKLLVELGNEEKYLESRKVKLDQNIANVWPEIGTNGKDDIKVCHVLNHTSGLHNALAILRGENPLLMCDWEECMNQICMSVPETTPGQEQLYHYLSFGWLCGGIMEHVSGKKFQEILEAIIQPLKIEGELYVGIPPDDSFDLSFFFQLSDIAQQLCTLPALFNTLNVFVAIIPAANGHCSARALARYYAALVDGGTIPLPHSSFSKPPLGSHPHIPKFPSEKTSKRQKGKSSSSTRLAVDTDSSSSNASAADNFASEMVLKK
ncbi:hypothetical protein GH714_008345 [Hevea brasiliensis]|uniref:ABC1 atypical kinase-like domain-containing protein n=1 Tax=Hevea brasiliensis TaxID=3981 RepID=A0A6A6LMW2_HEVBR|nr:hypothetical protein GH714_008345 [Hevea brasiliensis]